MKYKNKFYPQSLFFNSITDEDIKGWKAGLKAKDVYVIEYSGFKNEAFTKIHICLSFDDVIWGAVELKGSDTPDFFVIRENPKEIIKFSDFIAEN